MKRIRPLRKPGFFGPEVVWASRKFWSRVVWKFKWSEKLSLESPKLEFTSKKPGSGQEEARKDHFGTLLGPFWDNFGIILVPV